MEVDRSSLFDVNNAWIASQQIFWGIEITETNLENYQR